LHQPILLKIRNFAIVKFTFFIKIRALKFAMAEKKLQIFKILIACIC